METLNSLSLAQWIFIIIGVVIAGSAALPWLKEKIDEWQFTKIDPKEKNRVVLCDENLDLTNIVCKWECLADACEYMGLEEASAKLDEVFPLLIKIRADDPEEEEF